MKKQWKKMSVEEVRLARAWYENDNFKPSKIAGLLGRAKSALTRLLVKQVPRKKQGRKPVLTACQVDFLVRRTARLRRTAIRLPAAFVKKSIEDMKRRCQRLYAAKGGYFEEGGRRGC